MGVSLSDFRPPHNARERIVCPSPADPGTTSAPGTTSHCGTTRLRGSLPRASTPGALRVSTPGALARLLSRANGAGQAAVVGSIFRVPKGQAHLHSPGKGFEFFHRPGGCLGGNKFVGFNGRKVLVMPKFEDCIENISHFCNHSILPKQFTFPKEPISRTIKSFEVRSPISFGLGQLTETDQI